jgi:RsmE family RNA methyltransferase
MNLILFEQNETDENLRINLKKTDNRAVHLIRILKAEAGTIFEAGIINGKRGKAIISDITDDKIKLTFVPENSPSGLHPVTLILGLSRPPTVRKVLKEATALGVCRFILCRTENGERSYLQSSGLKADKLRELFIEGAQQAFCTNLPDVEICDSLSKAVRLAGRLEAADIKIALDNVEAGVSLTEFWRARLINNVKTTGTVLAVGSERGWTDSERKILRINEFTFASLGERILRTETASIAGTAICLSGMGLI